MDETNGNRRNRHLHSLLFIILVLAAVRGGENHDGGGKKDPSLVERAIGFSGLESRWDAVRSWAKLAWMNLRPPDSGYGQSGSSGAEVMKEAATESFKTGKETVEKTAASAAKAASKAVDKTTETLKRTMSVSEQDHDVAEL